MTHRTRTRLFACGSAAIALSLGIAVDVDAQPRDRRPQQTEVKPADARGSEKERQTSGVRIYRHPGAAQDSAAADRDDDQRLHPDGDAGCANESDDMGARSTGVEPPFDQYAVHLMVTDRENRQRHMANDEFMNLFEELPVRQDAVMLYTSQVGWFPRQGPHMIAADPAWMDRHEDRIRRRLPDFVDASFEGVAMIDYEFWHPIWDHTGENYRGEWRKTIWNRDRDKLRSKSHSEREDYYERTYNEMAQHFYLRTLEVCREVAPNAKWGYFHYPKMLYNSRYTGPRVIGYGPVATGELFEASLRNNDYDWLVEAVDYISIAIYPVRITVPYGEPITAGQTNHEWADREFVLSNIREAVRVANGKPVLAVMSPTYRPFRWLPRNQRSDLLNEIQTKHQILMPLQAGAAGVIMWTNLSDARDAQNLAAWIQERAIPYINQISTMGSWGNEGETSGGSAG